MTPASTPAGPSRGPDQGPALGPVPDRDWLVRDVLAVAPDLLGTFLTTTADGEPVTLRITEVEAYRGGTDPASHAFRGRSARNAAMFGEPGRLYVYRHLGLHTCVNIVCGLPGSASAVLLRAGEVVSGSPVARARRLRTGVVSSDTQIARGPARLTVALGIDLGWYGTDVTEPGGVVVLRLPAVAPPAVVPTAVVPTAVVPTGGIATGPRVGVNGPGGDGDRYPWRFWLAGEPTVSAYRPGSRRSPQARAPRAGA